MPGQLYKLTLIKFNR